MAVKSAAKDTAGQAAKASGELAVTTGRAVKATAGRAGNWALDASGKLETAAKSALTETWTGSKSAMADFAQSLAGQDGTIHGFVSADKMNALMESSPGWDAAWQDGTAVADMTLAKGDKVFMVVDRKTYDDILNDKFDKAFGGWATFDDVPSQAAARNDLALTPAMKQDACCVVELELTRPANGYVGVVKGQTYTDIDGVEHTYSGGGNQVHFNLSRDDRAKVFKVIGKRILK